MLQNDIIEPSVSAWVSPIVIAKKKDGAIRICIDYRKLNSRTQIDTYPMQRINDILDQIRQAKYISTLNLTKGYWQVPVAEPDRENTAFTSPMGLFQFCTMPFCLCGAPATFQCSWIRSLGASSRLQKPTWTIWLFTAKYGSSTSVTCNKCFNACTRQG